MSNVASVQKSAKEMISKAGGDSSSLQSDLIELTSAWDSVSRLSISKQSRLEQALKLVSCFCFHVLHSSSFSVPITWLGDGDIAAVFITCCWTFQCSSIYVTVYAKPCCI